MTDDPRSGIGLADPSRTWEALSEGGVRLLVDVRTRAEWTFVGLPDLGSLDAPLACVEWLSFPDMRPNPHFMETLARAVEETGAEEAYFICRSGARSQSAAEAAQARFGSEGRPLRCFNVVEGFEGDLDPDGRRGRVTGWKARGLPWRQS